MKKAVVAVLLSGVALSSSVYAAEFCHVPKERWKSEEALRGVLKQKNWNVKKIKVDEGCYEVYAKDPNGKRMEVFFNPETLEMLDAQE